MVPKVKRFICSRFPVRGRIKAYEPAQSQRSVEAPALRDIHRHVCYVGPGTYHDQRSAAFYGLRRHPARRNQRAKQQQSANEINVTDSSNAWNGPWWVSLIQTVGPTAVIAIFLVYVMAIQIVPTLRSLNEFTSMHLQQMQTLIGDEKDDAAQRQRQWDMIGRLQVLEHQDREAELALEYQTCINTAKSTYQSNKCEDLRNNGEAH